MSASPATEQLTDVVLAVWAHALRDRHSATAPNSLAAWTCASTISSRSPGSVSEQRPGSLHDLQPRAPSPPRRERRPSTQIAPFAIQGVRRPATSTRPSATSSQARVSSRKSIPCSQIQRAACSPPSRAQPCRASRPAAACARAARSCRSEAGSRQGRVELGVRQWASVEPGLLEMPEFGNVGSDFSSNEPRLVRPQRGHRL